MFWLSLIGRLLRHCVVDSSSNIVSLGEYCRVSPAAPRVPLLGGVLCGGRAVETAVPLVAGGVTHAALEGSRDPVITRVFLVPAC